MRPPRRPRRSGTSLMEVLIAIFIMALGLMALLTLFPLGLLQMAASIKDDQCARGAANAEGTIRFLWKQMWEDVPPSGSATSSNLPPLDAAGIISLLDTNGRVYLDPVGSVSNAGTAAQNWIAGVPMGAAPPFVGTPRSTISIGNVVLGNLETTPFRPATRRFCSLLDDIGFDRQGQPDNNNLAIYNSGSVRREGRYNFAWLLTRRFVVDPVTLQKTFSQPRYEANLTVVVYGGLKGARSMDLPATETPYTAMFTAGSTSAQLLYDTSLGQTKPNLSRNSWVYDNQNGYFYRVVDVSEDQLGPTQFQVNLELQTPAVSSTVTPPSLTPSFVSGAGVVMELIAEVFDMGTISPSTVPVLQP